MRRGPSLGDAGLGGFFRYPLTTLIGNNELNDQYQTNPRIDSMQEGGCDGDTDEVNDDCLIFDSFQDGGVKIAVKK